jgi:hemoglobin/transferrin/lactoferrin receptor protein
MRRLLILAVLLLHIFLSFSQTITVVDLITLTPIQGVIISSKNFDVPAVTDSRGMADISRWQGTDSIFIQHISYNILVLSYSQIESLHFNLKMSASNIAITEVIVSANRWKINKNDFPQKFLKIDRREVRLQNPQTTADLLNNSGYVYIQKSQLAGGSPMIRGFSTNRILLVVDGVRMNNAIFRTGNLQNVISIDASALQNSEIIFGPGSVMYGSDAIGGVMDFQTLQYIYSEHSGAEVSGNALTRYSSANTERTISLDFTLGFKKLAFLSSFSLSAFNDLRTGSFGNSYYLRPFYQETIGGKDSVIVNANPKMQKYSGYKQYNFMQKIGYKASNALEISYGFYYSTTSDAPRYDRLTLDSNNDGKPDYAQWYYGPQQWVMNRFALTFNKENLFFDQLNAIAAYQFYRESRHDRKFNASSLRNQYEKVNAPSFNIDVNKNIAKEISLLYGGEFVANTIGSEANKLNQLTQAQTSTNTRYPNGSEWLSAGIYANLKYNVNSNWLINAGFRYSYYQITADFDTTMFPFPFTQARNSNGTVNGNIGLVYNVNGNLNFYLHGSTGYRSPNIDDIGKVFESEPGSIVVPNADLKPEYAYNVELGATKLFGHWVKMEVVGFYLYLDNALARRDFMYNKTDSIMYDGQLSRVQAIQNITSANVYGFQVGLDLNFGLGLGMSGTITYQKGKEKNEEDQDFYPLRHVPPTFGTIHLTYQRTKLSFDFYMQYNTNMNYSNLPLSERIDNAPYAKDENGLPYVPAWATFNFKATWFMLKNISINAGVENIADRLYRPFASGISAPGRNFIIALRSRF